MKIRYVSLDSDKMMGMYYLPWVSGFSMTTE